VKGLIFHSTNNSHRQTFFNTVFVKTSTTFRSLFRFVVWHSDTGSGNGIGHINKVKPNWAQ